MDKLLLIAASGVAEERPRKLPVGCCRECGAPSHLWEVRDGKAYVVATKDTANPLTHRHIPVRVSEQVAERVGPRLTTAEIPEGLSTRPLSARQVHGGRHLFGSIRLWWRLRRPAAA